MALEQHAFLSRNDVPSAADWQAAITQLGFELTLDPDLKPFEDSGHLPCKLGTESSGFEIYYEPADELLAAYPHLKDQVAERDYAISFRWGGDMAECACVLIASAALARSFNAVVFYPDDNLFYTADELITEAGQALAETGDTPQPMGEPQSKPKRWWEFWKS